MGLQAFTPLSKPPRGCGSASRVLRICLAKLIIPQETRRHVAVGIAVCMSAPDLPLDRITSPTRPADPPTGLPLARLPSPLPAPGFIKHSQVALDGHEVRHAVPRAEGKPPPRHTPIQDAAHVPAQTSLVAAGALGGGGAAERRDPISVPHFEVSDWQNQILES